MCLFLNTFCFKRGIFARCLFYKFAIQRFISDFLNKAVYTYCYNIRQVLGNKSLMMVSKVLSRIGLLSPLRQNSDDTFRVYYLLRLKKVSEFVNLVKALSISICGLHRLILDDTTHMH